MRLVARFGREVRPGDAAPRTRSPAPRTARSARSASRPSAKRVESWESFHPWFSQAAVAGAEVLDVAVAVAVAELVDPCERAIGGREQRVDLLPAIAPPLQLAEQHDEQRRGVDAAVVDAPAAE